MKNLKITYSIIVAILLCLCSCEHKHSSSFALDPVEVEKYPDSALLILDSIKSHAKLCTEDAMLVNLLTIQAKDLCFEDITQKEDVKDIKTIISYYKFRRNDKLLKLAYYYAGRIHAELHDAPEATKYFLKAKEVNVPYMVLNCKIASQLGYLFYDQQMQKKAKKKFFEAYRLAKEAKDTVRIIRAARDIASTYWDNQEKTDSCLKLLHEAYQMAEKYKDPILLNNVRGYLAGTYITLGNYQQAKAYILPCLKLIAKDDTSGVYSLAADIYVHLDKDSAQIFYNYLVKKGNMFAKEEAYRYFTEQALDKRNFTDAKSYFTKYVAAIEYVRDHTEAEVSAKVDYQHQQAEKERVKAEKAKEELIYSMIIASLAIVICIIFSLAMAKKQKMKTRIKLLEKVQQEILQKSKEQRDKNKQQVAELQSKIADMNAGKEELLDQINKLKASITIQEIEKKEEDRALAEFMQSDIGMKINVLLQKGSDTKRKNLNVAEKDLLLQTFDSYFPKMEEKLQELVPTLKQEEKLACVLTKAGFGNSQIGALLNYSPSGVTKLKERLFKRTFAQKGCAKEWDAIITGL